MTIQNVNRRQFLTRTGGALLAGTFAAPYLSRVAFGATSTPKFEVLETKTFSAQPDVYFGWPTVAKRGKELLVVASGGREGHICPFGRVDLLRSKDDGATWSWPQTIYDGPIDDRDAGICVAQSGTILVTTFTSLAYEPTLNAETARREQGEKAQWSDERYSKWIAAHSRISDAERKQEVGCWMLRSTDGGINWSNRYATPLNSPHGPIQLSDGRLLYAGTELWTPEHRCGACVSSDDGRTWEMAGVIPTRDGDDRKFYYELHAVEATDGRIVAMIRNGNKNNTDENLQTDSTDGGKTWSTPRSIGVWGIPAFLTRLQDGRLLTTYGHRRDPLGVQARVSDDCGETWSEPLVLYGGATSGDLGYPSTVQLDDGTLFTVWYEVEKGSWSARLRCARWRIDG